MKLKINYDQIENQLYNINMCETIPEEYHFIIFGTIDRMFNSVILVFKQYPNKYKYEDEL